MKLEMKVPSPGESITEVEIAQWLVSDGDFVEKDQAIAEVDSDKATLDLPAEASGVITLKAEEGDSVEVGQVICFIDTEATGGQNKSQSSNEIIEKEVDLGAQKKDFTPESFFGEFGKGATFPQVTVDGQRLGGASATVKYLKENKLV